MMNHKPEARAIRNAAGEMIALVRPSCPPAVQPLDLELAACPFCGHTDMLDTKHVEGTILHPTYYIHCDYCGIDGPKTDKGNHAELWNRRSAIANSSSAVEKLKKTVAKLTAALLDVKNAIVQGGEGKHPAVTDTLWMPQSIEETVVDYIDSALEGEGVSGEQGTLDLK